MCPNSDEIAYRVGLGQRHSGWCVWGRAARTEPHRRRCVPCTCTPQQGPTSCGGGPWGLGCAWARLCACVHMWPRHALRTCAAAPDTVLRGFAAIHRHVCVCARVWMSTSYFPRVRRTLRLLCSCMAGVMRWAHQCCCVDGGQAGTRAIGRLAYTARSHAQPGMPRRYNPAVCGAAVMPLAACPPAASCTRRQTVSHTHPPPHHRLMPVVPHTGGAACARVAACARGARGPGVPWYAAVSQCRGSRCTDSSTVCSARVPRATKCITTALGTSRPTSMLKPLRGCNPPPLQTPLPSPCPASSTHTRRLQSASACIAAPRPTLHPPFRPPPAAAAAASGASNAIRAHAACSANSTCPPPLLHHHPCVQPTPPPYFNRHTHTHTHVLARPPASCPRPSRDV